MSTHPSESLATLRPDLSGSLEEFSLSMNREGMIGLLVAPAVDVAKPSGTFGRIKIEELLKSRETRRAPGSGYGRGSGRFETDTYNCKEHGFEEPVDDREAAMYENYIDAEMLATTRARNAVMENFEKRIAALASSVSNTTAAGTAWTNTLSAEPIDNVREAIKAVRERTGLIPNTLEISWDRFQHLKDNDQIVDRIKHAGIQDPNRGSITLAALASAFGIERVVVAGMMKNTAAEGSAASLSSVWPDNRAHVMVTPRTRDHREPCWIRTFHWAQDGSQIGAAIETYRDETVRSNVVRARMDTDEKVMYADAVEAITGV